MLGEQAPLPLSVCDCSKTGLTPRTPKEFFNPNSLRASREDLSAEGLCAPLTPGPLRVGFADVPFDIEPRRGDQETRYLEL